MKKIYFLLLIFFIHTNVYSQNIVYLDVQYIIDNSDIGKFYKSKINTIQDENSKKLKVREDEINKEELSINNQKNILSKEEIQKKIKSLNDLLKNYQTYRNDLKKNVVEKKKLYTSKILENLNPLLTEYVDSKNITLVVEKKNILVGIKSLDITPEILKILNEKTKKNNLINEN